MKVLLISPSLMGGGAERVAADLSLGLAPYAEIFLMTYEKKEVEYPHGGVRINIDSKVGSNVFHKVLRALQRIHAVWKVERENGIDCTISMLPQVDYASVFSPNKKVKRIVYCQTNETVSTPTRLQRVFRKLVLKRADLVLTTAHSVAQELHHVFALKPEQVGTVYPSISVNQIREKSLQKPVLKEGQTLPEKFILSVGSFRHPKGHWHLIRAFASVAEEIPEYKLVILGEGGYRTLYEKIMERFGLQDRVVLPGFINPPYSVMARSDLFVSSSVYEGFGLVIVEAMASGTPILSTDYPYGAREILAPGTEYRGAETGVEYGEYGVLVSAWDVSDIDADADISEAERCMGRAIADMVQNQARREAYAVKSKERCKAFDHAEATRTWYEFIENCCET